MKCVWNVRMARSAALHRWMWGGTSWKFTSCAHMKSFIVQFLKLWFEAGLQELSVWSFLYAVWILAEVCLAWVLEDHEVFAAVA